MSYDNILASAIGGLLSGLRYVKEGWIKVLVVAVTGASLGYYAALDLAKALTLWLGFSVSYGTVLFLLSYFGPDILTRATAAIQNMRLSQLWNNRR